MKLSHRLLATAAAAAVSVAALVTVAHATETANTASAGTAAGPPPSAVEDFSYPNAAQIEAQKGIVLKRGDGHIILADCASATDLMEVYSRTHGKFCFRVSGKSGYLSLEIPAVYGMKTDSAHRADVRLIAEGSEQNVAVPKDEFKGVGQANDPESRDHTLVEISTSA
ncbi:hypothetical protein AB0K57_22385 [Streptomyces halstedii]|uniref:hypothetical protein n=1 Tax=Streptomyces halstedii TaxID=1944 RepID=UPI0034610221